MLPCLPAVCMGSASMPWQLHLMRKGAFAVLPGRYSHQAARLAQWAVQAHVAAWAPGYALGEAAACVQVHRQFRKPLIVMSPKNLLRHPEAKSGLWEFDDVADDKGILGVRFKRVIMDESVSDRWAWLLGKVIRGQVPAPPEVC